MSPLYEPAATVRIPAAMRLSGPSATWRAHPKIPRGIATGAVPLTEDADEIKELDMAHALAKDFAGWPLFWLLKEEQAPMPQQDDLEVPAFDNPLARRHAEALAAARLGFRVLTQLLWPANPELRPDLDLDKIVADITADSERGSAADRLREALWEDFTRRPMEYTPHGGVRGSRGFHLKAEDDQGFLSGAVAYFPSTVKEIAEQVGVGVATAMRGLRDQGVLDAPDDGKNLARLVRHDGKQSRMYVLADLHENEISESPFLEHWNEETT